MESGQEWILGERNRRAGAEIPGSRSMLTLQEIAETFRVTRSTIHRLLKSNQFRPFVSADTAFSTWKRSTTGVLRAY
jgi:predicted DNA-binding transcriptional regulator AlpA